MEVAEVSGIKKIPFSVKETNQASSGSTSAGGVMWKKNAFGVGVKGKKKSAALKEGSQKKKKFTIYSDSDQSCLLGSVKILLQIVFFVQQKNCNRQQLLRRKREMLDENWRIT